jgi:predicted Co/Zn/Cd cation transporter (cation efflux family)
MGRIFHYLVKLPTGEFNRAMRDILAETPQGLRLIQQLVNEIRQANGPQESLAQKIIRRRLE